MDLNSSEKKWQAELIKLRSIILDCDLEEELKWGQPCYTYQNNNVIILIGLKDYCGFSFFKGALLKDHDNILVKPGPNTQSARIIKFGTVQQIEEMEGTIKSYILEAIQLEKLGMKVDFKEKYELVLPEEFQNKLDNDRALNDAFSGLTPGRQRTYNLYFSSAKQSKTRIARIEKCTKKILNGKGLNDYVPNRNK